MEHFLQEIALLDQNALSHIYSLHSTHSSHNSMKIHTLSILAARAIATPQQIRLAESVGPTTSITFTKDQEADFARLQLQLNDLRKRFQQSQNLPLLHLSPCILLIDEQQKQDFDFRIAAAKNAVIDDLWKAEEEEKKRLAILKASPSSSNSKQSEGQMKKGVRSPGKNGGKGGNSGNGNPNGNASNSSSSNKDVSEIIREFALVASAASDDGEGEWQQVGSKTSSGAVPPPPPSSQPQPQSNHRSKHDPRTHYHPPEPHNADTPKLQKMLKDLGLGSRDNMEKLISEGKVSVNNQTAHIGQRVQTSDSIKVNGKIVSAAAPAALTPPATQAADAAALSPSPEQMVTKDKYDRDMRELRLFFEEQIQVLQMRLHILTTKMDLKQESSIVGPASAGGDGRMWK